MSNSYGPVWLVNVFFPKKVNSQRTFMIVPFLNTDYAVNMIYGATYGVVYAFFSKK